MNKGHYVKSNGRVCVSSLITTPQLPSGKSSLVLGEWTSGGSTSRRINLLSAKLPILIACCPTKSQVTLKEIVFWGFYEPLLNLWQKLNFQSKALTTCCQRNMTQTCSLSLFTMIGNDDGLSCTGCHEKRQRKSSIATLTYVVMCNCNFCICSLQESWGQFVDVCNTIAKDRNPDTSVWLNSKDAVDLLTSPNITQTSACSYEPIVLNCFLNNVVRMNCN